MKKTIIAILALAASAVLFSCSEIENADEKPQGVYGTSIYLPSEYGSVMEVTLDVDGEWNIVNMNSWVGISPLKGVAGENTLKFRITETNDGIKERVSYFDMTVSGETIRYWLIQDGRRGVEIVDSEYIMSSAVGGVVRMEVLTNTEFDVQSSESWAVVEDIEYGQDSVLLEDGSNYSDLQTAYIHVAVSENTGNTQRETVLLLTCGEQRYELSVLQYAELTSDVDWSGEFYKTTIGLKFTGQSCQNCPKMAENFHKAQEQRSGHFEILNMHGYQPVDELYYDNAAVFRDYYDVSGFPHGIFNSMADLENETGLVNKIVSLIDEALAVPAKTAISMNSVWDGTSLSLDGFIATREELDYKIHIFVMENDIIARQSGGSTDYEHDAVLRYAVTDELGDALNGTGAEKVVGYANSVQLPSNVFYNDANGYVLIFTTYAHSGRPDGSVSGIEYSDYGMIVDNVAVLPLNGQTAFRYED